MVISKAHRGTRHAGGRFATCAGILLAGLACAAGCGKSNPPPAAPAPAPAKATITATPNPVPAGTSKFGTTAIAWDTGDGRPGEVWVSTKGGPEQKFAGPRPKGTQEAPWIGRAVHEFRLYAGTEHKELLASVKVTRAAK
jgi:hypothetical protein